MEEPSLNEEGASKFRLQHMTHLRNQLETEISTREGLSQKYARASKVFVLIDTLLVVTSIGLGAAGISVLATVVATPVAIAMEGVAGACGIGCMLCKYFGKQMDKKVEKHRTIATIASSKLNSIVDLVSKAIEDGKISSTEFQTVVTEFDRYRAMKDEVHMSDITAAEIANILKDGPSN